MTACATPITTAPSLQTGEAEIVQDQQVYPDGNTYAVLAVTNLPYTATADSSTAALTVNRVQDTNLATQWNNGPYQAASAWVRAELAQTSTIANIKVKTGTTAAGTSYDIQVSNDGTTWTTVLANVTNASWNLETKLMPANTVGKYVRLFFKNRATNPVARFAVFELAVEGEPTVVTPPPDPDPDPGATPPNEASPPEECEPTGPGPNTDDPLLQGPAPTVAGVQGAHVVAAFLEAEMIALEGYNVGDEATVRVWRPSTNRWVAAAQVEIEAGGVAEINHPDTPCWNQPNTNLQPGDVIEVTAGGVTDTMVLNHPVVTGAPTIDPVTGDVVVLGNAKDAAGNPIPLALIEHELVSPTDRFIINGQRRRAIGAPGEGTISVVAGGAPGDFRVTYSGLDDANKARALNAEINSAVVVQNGNEITITEFGGAPEAGCVPPPATP